MQQSRVNYSVVGQHTVCPNLGLANECIPTREQDLQHVHELGGEIRGTCRSFLEFLQRNYGNSQVEFACTEETIRAAGSAARSLPLQRGHGKIDLQNLWLAILNFFCYTCCSLPAFSGSVNLRFREATAGFPFMRHAPCQWASRCVRTAHFKGNLMPSVVLQPIGWSKSCPPLNGSQPPVSGEPTQGLL